MGASSIGFTYITDETVSSGSNSTPAYSTSTTNPSGNSSLTGSVTIPEQQITTSSTTVTDATRQTAWQITATPEQTTTTTTTQQAAQRSVEQGNSIAVKGIDTIYQSTAPNLQATPDWDTLQNVLFGSYRNEVHSFMLGNINDYLNRWASIQNDLQKHY